MRNVMPTLTEFWFFLPWILRKKPVIFPYRHPSCVRYVYCHWSEGGEDCLGGPCGAVVVRGESGRRWLTPFGSSKEDWAARVISEGAACFQCHVNLVGEGLSWYLWEHKSVGLMGVNEWTVSDSIMCTLVKVLQKINSAKIYLVSVESA